MKGLLIKDLCLLTQRQRTLLIFVAVSFIMGLSTDGSFVVGYMSFLSVIISLSTISYDEADNGMPFLLTLPVDRKTYARSKYALSSILAVASWLFALVMLQLIALLKGVSSSSLEDIKMSLAFLPMALLIIDLMVPLQLRFGAEGSRIVMLIVFGGITALGFIFRDKAEKIAVSIERANIPDGCYLLLALVLCIALTLLSVRASCRIMEKKSF